jgi:hypothetical protein
MGIACDVGGAVDAAGRHFGLVHGLEHFVLGMPRGPGRDRLVDARHLRGAAVVTGERRIIAQVLAPDGAHEPAKERVGVAGDEDVRAVAAWIEIRRGDAGKRAARALSDGALRVVLRQQAFGDIEHRLVQRDVDHLALAAVLHVM